MECVKNGIKCHTKNRKTNIVFHPLFLMSLSYKHTSILNDVSSVIEHMKANKELYAHRKPLHESDDNESESAGPRYNLLLNDNDRDHYYSDVAICRFLFYDIRRGADRSRLLRHIPQIGSVDPKEIEKIFFDPESEEFVILSRSGEIRIYRGDIRYIYPYYCQIRDPIEYELAYEGDKVYSYNKFNDESEAPISY